MSIGYGPYSGKGMSQLDRIETMLVDLLAKKKPGKPRSSKVEYNEAFIILWDMYPKRSGSNPKRKAWQQFLKRRSERIMHSEMQAGIQRYKNFCGANGTIGSCYVMQMATFLGAELHFDQSWEIPAKQEAVPKDDNKLSSWAAERGYRGAWAGESHAQFRRALKTLHRSNDNE